MMKAICEKNGGFRFKAGVKLKDRKQHQAFLRIKEKMLDKHLEQLNEKMKNMKFDDSLSVEKSILQEKAVYEK